MLKYLVSFIIVLILAIKPVLSQQVISSGGDYFDNTIGSVSFTIGESIIETYKESSLILTTGFQQPLPIPKILNLKVYLEGLYDNTVIMRQAYDAAGPHFAAGIADQVTVELHNATLPYGMAYPYSNVNLNTDGTLSINKIPGTLTGSYYIVVKHRNSIETWSMDPVSFTGAGPFIYDFSIAATQAFGSNLKQMGTVYVIWSADANQDGTVDGTDMLLIDNASTPPVLEGYFPQDINGDGSVDGTDMVMVDNNSTPPNVEVKKP